MNGWLIVCAWGGVDSGGGGPSLNRDDTCFWGGSGCG